MQNNPEKKYFQIATFKATDKQNPQFTKCHFENVGGKTRNRNKTGYKEHLQLRVLRFFDDWKRKSYHFTA